MNLCRTQSPPLLHAGSPATRHACCRAIMNLCRSSSARREATEAGAVPILLRLLRPMTVHTAVLPSSKQHGEGRSKGEGAAGAPGSSQDVPHETPRIALSGAQLAPTAVANTKRGTFSTPELFVPEAAAGALYNLISSRAALAQAVRVGGVALLSGAACACPPSKCQRLLVKVLHKIAVHSEVARGELAVMARQAASRRGAGTGQGMPGA